MRALLIAVAAWSLLSACSTPQSTRCRSLCQRMTTCVDTLGRTDIVIDETECTTTCTMLERDGEGAKHVQAHAECARNAVDCEALLACL